MRRVTAIRFQPSLGYAGFFGIEISIDSWILLAISCDLRAKDWDLLVGVRKVFKHF